MRFLAVKWGFKARHRGENTVDRTCMIDGVKVHLIRGIIFRYSKKKKNSYSSSK